MHNEEGDQNIENPLRLPFYYTSIICLYQLFVRFDTPQNWTSNLLSKYYRLFSSYNKFGTISINHYAKNFKLETYLYIYIYKHINIYNIYYIVNIYIILIPQNPTFISQKYSASI